jgi:hypothetical protein
MTHRHTVQKGECLASIAYGYGFHPDTVWNHPENAALRGERTSYYVLLAGDVVFVPERRERLAECATGKRHRFRRRGVPELFRLELRAYGEPRANLDYVLEIDGKEMRGTTDAEGRIEVPIPPDARRGVLRIGEHESYTLALGYVDPIDTDTGVRDRLVNLAYLDRGDTEPGALRDALRALQRAHGLPATGTIDDPTRAALVKEHGS